MVENRTWVTLDIETRPIPALVDNPAYWERRESDLRTPANYKDPDKIAAWRSDKIHKLRQEMALSPLTGEVCVIGWHDGNDRSVLHGGSEKDLLRRFGNDLDTILHRLPIVGFNIKTFDLPFLWARCAINHLMIDLPRPRDYTRVGELREILLEGPLSEWCLAFGLEEPPVDAEALGTASIELLIEKNKHDVTVTRIIAEKLQGALSCLHG